MKEYMSDLQTVLIRRMTTTMWELLRYAKDNGGAMDVFGSALNTARILARRGFVTVGHRGVGGFHRVCLTKAGSDVLQVKRTSRMSTRARASRDGYFSDGVLWGKCGELSDGQTDFYRPIK